MNANNNKDPDGLIVFWDEDELGRAWVWITSGGSLYPANSEEARRIGHQLLAFADQSDAARSPALPS
jgi:hypothetical protein